MSVTDSITSLGAGTILQQVQNDTKNVQIAKEHLFLNQMSCQQIRQIPTQKILRNFSGTEFLMLIRNLM